MSSAEIENKENPNAEIHSDPKCVGRPGKLEDTEILQETEKEDSSKVCVVQEIEATTNEAPVLPVILMETSSRSSGNKVDRDFDIIQPKHIEDIETKSIPESPKKENVLKKYVKEKFDGFSERQIRILVVLGIAEILAAACIAIEFPFFPAEAAKKGACGTESGIVFGVFALAYFISRPIYGYHKKRWNPKIAFTYGICITGISCVIFGFLNYISNRHLFIFICIIVQTIEAVGFAAFVTSCLTIFALEFPNLVTTTLVSMELAFYGVGAIVGLPLGGLLFDAGGYTIPFIVMGGGLFITAAAAHYVLPNIENTIPDLTQQTEQVTNESFSFPNMMKWIKDQYGMARNPTVALEVLSVIAVTSGVGFIANTLQPHLNKEFNTTSGTILGLFFVLNFGSYYLSATYFGRLAERSTNYKYYTIAGAGLTSSGFLLLGPVSFLPFNASILAACIGLALCGLGMAATFATAFKHILNDAITNGFPEDLSTYSLVSGLWSSLTFLGFFIGAVIGGILLDIIGFRWGTLFIIVEQLIIIGLVTNYLVRLNRGKKTKEENESEPASATAITIESSTGVANKTYVHEDGKDVERTR